MDPDRIVRDFSAAWGRADLDAILDAFSEDAVYHNMPMEPLSGKVASIASLRQISSCMHVHYNLCGTCVLPCYAMFLIRTCGSGT